MFSLRSVLRPVLRRTFQYTPKAQPASLPRISMRSFSFQTATNPTKRWFAIAAAGAAVGSALLMVPFDQERMTATAAALSEASDTNANNSGDTLFTLDEFQAMSDEGRIVVAYQGEVFDVSSFSGHPGGVGRLKMASGHDLEKYWAVYTQHNRGHIQEVMAPYRIGRVSADDMRTISENTYYDASAYENNPKNYPELLTNTRYPYNAEAKLSTLTDEWITPIGRHFVRNHCAVPDIDPEEYQLTVRGEGLQETTFTLEDLKKKFPKVEVVTVIQCNGNRREDCHYVDGKTPAFGPPHWVAGAIANSKWAGVRLRDVLRASGMDVDAISLGKVDAPERATQVSLLGYDHDEVGNQYCCSFPFDKAVDPFGDVILAYEMNGEDIPRSHGYPVRAIVPGHAGARNCKYLEKVTISDTPCKGHTNWKQYAVHAPDVGLRKIAEFEDHKKELVKDPAVQEMPVQSMITSPTPNEIIAAAESGEKTLRVKGIAWGGGGAGINRVDVSIDNGKTFTRANVCGKPIKERRKSQWSWSFFEKEIPIPEDMRRKLKAGQQVEMTLTSKALNTAWNVQPENVQYNAHGCCVNHWYRVPVTLDPHLTKSLKEPEGDFANKPSGGKFATRFCNLDTRADLDKRIANFSICTCGNNCKLGTGCLQNRFCDSHATKLQTQKLLTNKQRK